MRAASEVGGVLYIRLCNFCGRPTLFEGDRQVPGAKHGQDVDHLPPDIGALYNEARDCMAASCYTAAALVCRKLLMNVAASRGADHNRKFAYYVDYLVNNNLVPSGSRDWIDHIRDKGNEATHEIPSISKEDAEQLMTFVEMLLKLVYEFPKRVAPKTP